jgi:hypothetical protein
VLIVRLEGLESEDAEQTLRALRRDLLDMTDVDSVDLSGAAPPPGSKAAGQIATQLVIETMSGVSVTALASFVGRWLGERRKRCQVRYTLPNGVEVELPGVDLQQVSDQLSPEVRALLGLRNGH